MTGKRLTIQHREKIEEGIKQKLPISEITSSIGFDRSTITREIKKNGGKENYNALEAQEKQNDTKNTRFKRILDVYQTRVENLEIQIQNMQMHLEIILEQIEKLTQKR